MIRPRPARWFEALVARDDCTVFLDALARTGAVELEARDAKSLPESFLALRPALGRFHELAQRFSAYWPVGTLDPSPLPEPPGLTLARDLRALEGWSREAEPAIRELQRCAHEREDLSRWQAVITGLDDAPLDLQALAQTGPLAQALLLEVPAAAMLNAGPRVLLRPVEADGKRFALALGPRSELAAIEREAIAAGGRTSPVPHWLAGSRDENLARILARRAEIEDLEREGRTALQRDAARHRLGRVLGNLYRLQWVMQNVRALEYGERFAWITGWSSDFEGRGLVSAVDQCRARALLHFPPAPPGRRGPLLLANPRWARPFELFTRALGMPGREDADPTLLLAVVAPLMFGYMFGDVGQGLVIAGAAWFLRRRHEIARLLFAGGLAAAAFGLLFGSFFSLEHVIAPLWRAPLSDPLAVLAVPIAVGALLLACGLVLQMLESWWHGDLARCLGFDAGLLVAYAGALGGFLDARLWALVVPGFVAVVAGEAWRDKRLGAAAGAVGAFVERLLQLLVNTLSFVRVGAFALAHAGLSAAVVALSAAAPDAVTRLLVLLAGNAVILALETLVVSIQTTRLVLFEFFTRFFSGGGRAFRPLPPPPLTLQEH